jgi:Uma2 family endonuclease
MMAIDVEKQTMLTPADWVPGPGQGNWTYDYYATLPEDGHRYEIVDGVLLDMTPAPGIPHQNAVLQLSHYLIIYVKNVGIGKVFLAPIDMELTPKKVFQPDVAVVLNARLDIITTSHISGAPDLIIEVASPRATKYDQTTKRKAYALAGVTEYWLVDPIAETVEVLSLQDAAYSSLGIFQGENTLISQIVPAIAEVPVKQFFA